MIVVHGLANCDACRKARKRLERAGAAHRFHDLRKDGLDRETAEAWLAAIGPERLVNRRSATWRGLPEAERARLDADPAGLLCAHPALAKRPVIDFGGAWIAGFDAAAVAALEARLAEGGA